MTTRWTQAEIPPQNGRSAVVTGTGGLGFESALALARAGCDVTIAGRAPDKGAAAVAAIRRAVPGASVAFEGLDLADLASVADFAARLSGRRDRLDLLINNAGVMMPPKRRQTVDGFELQFGTNHLGHVALTARLMPLLRKGTGARVVAVSSVAARNGAIDFADLNSEKAYRPMPAYCQSKLACLMFALELERRSAAAGWGVAGIAAHPGIARTDLLRNAPGRWSAARLMRSALWFLFQPASQGALPTLFAATSPDARGGAYYGPDRMGEARGHPTRARTPPQALDPDTAARLWDVSLRLTGVSF